MSHFHCLDSRQLWALKMAHPKVAMHAYAKVGARGAIVEHWIWTSGLLILDRILMVHSST